MLPNYFLCLYSKNLCWLLLNRIRDKINCQIFDRIFLKIFKDLQHMACLWVPSSGASHEQEMYRFGRILPVPCSEISEHCNIICWKQSNKSKYTGLRKLENLNTTHADQGTLVQCLSSQLWHKGVEHLLRFLFHQWFPWLPPRSISILVP